MKIQSPQFSKSRRTVTALVGLPLAVGALWADDPAPPEEATEPEAEAETEAAESAGESAATAESSAELKNWIEFGVGGSVTSGHVPAYQRRYSRPEGALGGVEDFHFEQPVGKEGANGIVTLDGRAIFDNADYRFDLNYLKEELGYFKAGYREFRTWYDPSGGYFPPTGLWFSLYPDAVHTDTGTFYAEFGLRKPKLPEATVRYEHGRVLGEKDSTTWGQTGLTGGNGPRALVPTLKEVDRIRDLVMLDLSKWFSSTKVGAGLRWENQRQDNATLIRQNPGEIRDRHITQRDRSDSAMLNARGSVEHKLSSRITLTAGYAFTDLDTDTSGYRVYGRVFDPDYAQRLPAPGTYEGLSGGSTLQQHVGNFNLMTTLAEKLVLVPSLRVEGRTVDGSSLFTQPALPFTGSSYLAENQRSLLDVSEALDLRYSGITNWVFYARANWLQGSGDLREETRNLTTGTTVVGRDTDDTRIWQKYSAGANWYPLRRLSLGAEYFYKNRRNEFDHLADSTPNQAAFGFRYPAFLTANELTTDDVNFRVTWRPRGNLTLVARGDLQWSTTESQADGRAAAETADITSYIASGSASWMPFARLYLQANVSQVWDRTDTPLSDLSAAVQSAENDYLTANVTVGYALSEKTDVEAQYLYYHATNYQDNSIVGVPYGAGAEDNGITVGLIHRLSPRVRLSLKYGFFDSDDPLYGGNRDYSAHWVYSTMTYRF